jgi:two-component system, chemotaxis family, protein-glutamate methylesterase/glutaminase
MRRAEELDVAFVDDTRPDRGVGPWPAEPRVVVIGASAGGVEALQRVVRHLRPSLRAAIVVVLHMPPTAYSRLPEILSRAGPLPARQAVDGEHLEPGVVYVAPPDRHVVLGDHRLTLVEGPRENGVRPAIDPLMRSAARTFGERAIGVILSGTLDDGTAGLAAVHAYGGVTVAQAPDDAICPGMPLSAIDGATVDYVVAADDVGDLLADLVSRDLGRGHATARPRSVSSRATDLVCPECGGVLRQFEENGVFRFHCRVGHNYSPESLFAAHDGHLEAALWAAVRALEESASMAHRLAIAAHARKAVRTAERFEAREREAAERADVIRSAIFALSDLESLPDIAEAQPVAAEDDARRPVASDHRSRGAATVPVADRPAASRRRGEGDRRRNRQEGRSASDRAADPRPTNRSDAGNGTGPRAAGPSSRSEAG